MTVTKKIVDHRPLDSLSQYLKDDMRAVNQIILDKMQSEIPLIPELASHLIAAGGKRIRPLLTLAAAALFNCQNNRQHRLAACVEFIHTATLLHDDVVDASDQRRGRASANALFGNEAAVLVGDFLFSRSFQLMTDDGSVEVMKVLSNASAVIAEGEVFQLSMINDLSVTEDQYLRMIGAKTAALFAAACEVGGIVAGATPEQCRALKDYGACLGVVFQISDDVLDYAANAELLGKAVGDDFREGKVTLPVLKALAQADAAERAFWQRCLGDLNQNDKDLKQAIDLIKKHSAIEKSLKAGEAYVRQGRACLEKLPQHPLRDDLAELISFALHRDY